MFIFFNLNFNTLLFRVLLAALSVFYVVLFLLFEELSTHTTLHIFLDTS